MLSRTLSSLTLSFPGSALANGTDVLEITVTLINDDGSPASNVECALTVDPWAGDDTLAFLDTNAATTQTNIEGRAFARYTTKLPAIKRFYLRAPHQPDFVLEASVEFAPYEPGFLVEDPFTENGPLANDITLSGKFITVRAEADNNGAITELWWGGQQLLNTPTKDGGIQYKSWETSINYATVLAEAGRSDGSVEDPSTGRYVGNIINTRQLVTQAFVPYTDTLEYQGESLVCAGDLLTKQLFVDYIGNPNILRVDFAIDKYSSTKLGSRTFATSLSLVQTLSTVYTYRPNIDEEPVLELASTSGGTLATTFVGGVIAASADNTTALGIFHAPRTTGNSLYTTVIKPGPVLAGDPKLVANRLLITDTETSGGSGSGTEYTTRYICVGTLDVVKQAFDDLYRFITTGTQAPTPGQGGGEPTFPTSLQILSIPAAVTTNQLFNAEVAILNNLGEVDVTYTGPVTVALQNPSGVIVGTAAVTPVNGVAIFSGLRIASAGTWVVRFTAGALTTQSSVVVQQPVPVVTAVSPNTVADNVTSPVQVQISGLYFTQQSVVRYNGTTVPTQYNSATSLVATIPANLIQQGVSGISVFTPPPGGGLSNSVSFTVTDGTAPQIDDVSVTITVNNVLIAWRTSEPSRTELRYVRTAPTTGTVTVVPDPGLPNPMKTQHSVSFTVGEQADYQAFIYATDASGNTRISPRINFSIGDTTPPVVTNLQVQNVTSSSATISWVVNEPSTTVVSYNPAGGTATQLSLPVGVTQVPIAGLSASTVYEVRVRATNQALLQGPVVTTSFSTAVAGDTQPPSITAGPTVLGTTTTSATVTWTLDESATGVVTYGTSPNNYTSGSYTVQGLRTTHLYTVPNLNPSVTYYAVVSGQDAATPPNPYQSQEFTFTTQNVAGPSTLNPGDIVTTIETVVPPGKTAGDTYFCHTTVPLQANGDTALNWVAQTVVNGVGTGPEVFVQREINSYKADPGFVPGTGPFLVGGSVSTAIIEIESFTFHPTNNPQTGWVFRTDTRSRMTNWNGTSGVLVPDPHTGSGYYVWAGANRFGEQEIQDDGLLYVDVYVQIPGTYALFLRNRHEDPNPTENNDIWCRMLDAQGNPVPTGSGHTDWRKVFSNEFQGGSYPTGFWHWQSTEEQEGVPWQQWTRIQWTLSAGVHRLQLSARSQGFFIDRAVLAPPSFAPASTDTLGDQTLRQGGTSLPADVNAVECIFPITVPAGLIAGQKCYVTLKASTIATPPNLVPPVLDPIDLILEMPFSADQVADITDPNNIKVLKHGPWCTEYRYHNRLTDGTTPTLGVHSYITHYAPAIDDAVYIRLFIHNSRVDPFDTTRWGTYYNANGATAPGDWGNRRKYGVVGKLEFDQLVLDASATGKAITARHMSRCMEQVSDDVLKLVAYADSPSQVGRVNGSATSSAYATHRSFPGQKTEMWGAGMQRIEHLVLHDAAATVSAKAYHKAVLEFANVGKPVSGRNAGDKARWVGPCYMRAGRLPITYRASDAEFGGPTNGIQGGDGYDKQRMAKQVDGLKVLRERGFLQFNYNVGDPNGVPIGGTTPYDGYGYANAHIIISNWASPNQFGCWTPFWERDGGAGGVVMMNVYETDIGPGHTAAWSYFFDGCVDRHWFTQFDDNGEFVPVDTWFAAHAGGTPNMTNAGANWFVTTGTGSSGRGFPPFFALDQDKSIHKQPLFRPQDPRRCGYDDIAAPNDEKFPFDQLNAPFSDTHIQRIMRCSFNLTRTMGASLYRDMLRYQALYFIHAYDRRVTNSLTPTVGIVLNESTGANQFKGSKWGRGAGWAHFTIATWYMHAPLDSPDRALIYDHLRAFHTATVSAMPGGPERTGPGAAVPTLYTHNRHMKVERYFDSAWTSAREDCGAVLYEYQNASAPFNYFEGTQEAFKSAFQSINTPGVTDLYVETAPGVFDRRRIVIVRPTSTTAGRIGLWDTEYGTTLLQGFAPGAIGYVWGRPRSSGSISSVTGTTLTVSTNLSTHVNKWLYVFPPGNGTIPAWARQRRRIVAASGNTVTIDTPFNPPLDIPIGSSRGFIVIDTDPICSLTLGERIEDFRERYRQSNTLEEYLFLHSVYAVAEAVFRFRDPDKARIFYTYTYEFCKAKTEHPNYWAGDNYDNDSMSGGYYHQIAVAEANGTRVNDYYEKPPEAPFVMRYGFGTQATYVLFTQVCAAYASERLGIQQMGLDNTILADGRRIGPGTKRSGAIPNTSITITPSGFLENYQHKLWALGDHAWRGSNSNVAEKSYHWMPWVAEVDYWLQEGQSATLRTIEWESTTIQVSENTPGNVPGVRLRTEGNAPVSADVTVVVTPIGALDRYVLPNTTFVIPANQSGVSVPITIVDDQIYTGTEELQLVAAVVDGPAVSSAQRSTLTIIIQENDPVPQPAINFSTTSSFAYEGEGARVINVTSAYSVSTPITVSIGIAGTASTGDFTLAGLSSVTTTSALLTIPANQTTASFSVTAESAADPGETLIFTLQSGVGYTLGPNTTHTTTLQEISTAGTSFIVAARLGTADGTASTPTTELATQVLSAMVPVHPPSSALPEYCMAHPSNPSVTYRCDVVGTRRDYEGRWIEAFVSSGVPNTDNRRSIPGDVNNPAIELRKGPGNTTSAIAGQFKTASPNGYKLTIKLANVATPYEAKIDPMHGSLLSFNNEHNFGGSASSFLRRTEYRMRFIDPTPGSSEKALLVRFIKTDRTDIFARTLDIVIENSVCASSPSRHSDPRGVNNEADGIVTFDWIRFDTGNDERIVDLIPMGCTGLIAGTDSKSYYLVKPPGEIDQTYYPVVGEGPTTYLDRSTQTHKMLPGQLFVRRLVLYSGTISSTIATQVGERLDIGYVTGPLGYLSGGYGYSNNNLIDYGAPSVAAAATYASQSGWRAAIARSNAFKAETLSYVLNGNIFESGNEKLWGWGKPRGAKSPFDAGEQFITFHPRLPVWGSYLSYLSDVDRETDRYGVAAFNVATNTYLTDDDLVEARARVVNPSDPGSVPRRMPFTFNVIDRMYPDGIVPWFSVNDPRESTTVTVGNNNTWSKAVTTKPWNTAESGKWCFYIDLWPNPTSYPTIGGSNPATYALPNNQGINRPRLNWQLDGSYGPHNPTHQSRFMGTWEIGACILNDAVARIMLGYLGNSALMRMSRYRVPESDQGDDRRVRWNYALSQGGSLRLMEDTLNNSFGRPDRPLNRGFWYAFDSNTRYIQAHNTPRTHFHTLGQVAMYYSMAPVAVRNRIADNGGTTHNWIALASNFVGRVITGWGMFCADNTDNNQAYSAPRTASSSSSVPLTLAELNGDRGPLAGPLYQNNALVLNNTANKWYLHTNPAYHHTYALNACSAVLRLMAGYTGPYSEPWKRIVTFPEAWAESAVSKVVADPLNPGRSGVWFGSPLIMNKGEGNPQDPDPSKLFVDNPQVTAAAYRAGALWHYFVTETNAEYRRPFHFSYMLPHFYKMTAETGAPQFGHLETALVNTFSYANVPIQTFLATSPLSDGFVSYAGLRGRVLRNELADAFYDSVVMFGAAPLAHFQYIGRLPNVNS